MVLKQYMSRTVVCVFLIQLSLIVSYDLKPEIISEYETILEPGNNFTVLCQGHTPLTWSWPEVREDLYNNWTTIQVTSTLPKKRPYKYASRLFIQNITYPYTGFYKCMGENVSTSDEDQIAKVYLFVRDKEHLAVSDLEIDSIVATQYSDLVIPCRPTSPDVNVELARISGEKIENTTYDPKTGFTFFIQHLTDQDLYVCTFVLKNVEFELLVYVTVLPKTASVPKPILEEISGGHTIIGEKLVLECKVRPLTHISISWITPRGLIDPNRMEISQQNRSITDHSLVYERLIINSTTIEDRGVYYCNASDNQNHHSVAGLNVTIYYPDEHFINLTEENGVYILSTSAGEPNVQWRIDVKGHPEPTLTWLNNNNETIPSGDSSKYFTSTISTEAILKIKDVTITDFGNYMLVAENSFEKKTLSLFLNVTDKPSVHIESDDFHVINKSATLKCIAAAYPKPTLYWYFKSCLDNSCNDIKLKEKYSENIGLQLISYVAVESVSSGFVKCEAYNSLGSDKAIQPFYVTDVENGLGIFGFESTVEYNEKNKEARIAAGENFTLICGASLYNYTSVTWYRDEEKLESSNRYLVENKKTKYSNRQSLYVKEANFSDSGQFSCQVTSINGSFVYRNLSVIISKPSFPTITSTNLNREIEMELPDRLHLFCNVQGMPKPKIEWFKNDETLQPTRRIKLGNQNQNLSFSSTTSKDEGVYRCTASNKVGRVSRQVSLKFKNNPDSFNHILIYTLVVLVVFVIGIALFTLSKVRNERKLQRELKIAGLANFERGAMDNFNPELGIDDQAELLPYDKKWEFPITKLKLGKQLGSGAFGVVLKAEAKGIIEDEETTTVAVKMVKKNAGHTYIRALASELKIMVHLGKHLNVVNLLGACTKNVAKRELLVIVEYCRFGNIQNYLLRHRENFINQVDPKTGHVDYTICQDLLERTYSVSSAKSNLHSPVTTYAPNTMDYKENSYNGSSAKTEVTMISMSPSTGDEVILSNNSSIQPEWRSNYKGDYKDNINFICTKDLLTWSFQVSRGMEYLASRRVLHGDLAARNILLADNNVVKICDFGLAKSMYKNDNYKKKGNGPLPVKWMAIESIRDKIFSTQSDIWSFGIVLWELFSLARTPYPGMEADERLYNRLLDGYRMESPEYAPKEIYKMMLDCWHTKPQMRPSFTKVAERIGCMLEDTVRKHYIDLNDPYLVMNTQRLQEGQDDYLSMITPPDFENLSSPQEYMNDIPLDTQTPGYLPMNATNIFSPRTCEDGIFEFNFVPKKKEGSSGSEEAGNESTPMLEINNSGSGYDSPVLINSFSNPSYLFPPPVEKQTIKTQKDIVKYSDNYVNMPQNKIALNQNFTTNVESDNKHVEYVNDINKA